MKRQYLLTLCLLFFVATAACAASANLSDLSRESRQVVQETRPLGDFNEVLLRGAGELILTQAEAPALTIEASPSVIDRLRSEVVGNRLELGVGPDEAIFLPGKIVYYLSVTDLNAIEINGAARLSADGLHTESLTLRLNGSGQFDIANLQTRSFSANISGFGVVKAAGAADESAIAISGAGHFAGEGLRTPAASLTINGAGSAATRVAQRLNVVINGVGWVENTGQAELTRVISGVGHVRQSNH